MKKEKIVLTGVKPTGTPHLGNLVGAMGPVLEQSRAADKSFIFIADLHALNAMRNPEELQKHTTEVAAIYMALGLDTTRTAFFKQSDVPDVAVLSTLLMNITPKGMMNRAHSYKDAVAKNIAAAADDDAGINMGLYTYPVLMAADILLYDTDIVPVGRDQKQHLEFARDIAVSFNALYGPTFKLPEPFITEDTGIIPGLDGRKMSKSYGNQIPIMDPPDELRKKIMKIITDSAQPADKKNPDENTIYLLYKHFATADAVADLRARFLAGGLGYGDAKKILFEAVDKYLTGPREIYKDLIAHPEKIKAALTDGAARARPVAAATLARVRAAMGI
ncbi:MAG: tryptophan--tRNA ligase [Rickettsiales bacterium]|jgi:tryptophanyl-tRNA synthetase|nr:tryptophan--tRNA ligase [Rickettsiales bacterium]